MEGSTQQLAECKGSTAKVLVADSTGHHQKSHIHYPTGHNCLRGPTILAGQVIVKSWLGTLKLYFTQESAFYCVFLIPYAYLIHIQLYCVQTCGNHSIRHIYDTLFS